VDSQNILSNTFAKARIVTGISFVLGLLFDYFFYDKIPGIVFPLYVILVIAGLFVIANFLKKQINKEVLIPLALLIFFSTMVFIRSSDLLIFLNVIASLLLLLVITEISFGEEMKNFSVEDYLKIFFLPFKFIHPLFETMSNLFSLREAKEDRKVFSQIVKGVLMTIPVLFVFLLLFFFGRLDFSKVCFRSNQY